MNVALILLTLNRNDLTKRVIDQNFFNCGLNADCFLVDNGSEDVNFNYPLKIMIYQKPKGV